MQRKRRIDEVNDQSSSSKQGLYECLFCALSTNQYGNLMEHLEHVHGRKFPEKTLVFPRYTKFQRWVDRLSTEDGATFVRINEEKTPKGTAFGYSCSCTHTQDPSRWKYGCISSLHVVHMKDDKVIAKYQPFHSNHRSQVKTILPKKKKSKRVVAETA